MAIALLGHTIAWGAGTFNTAGQDTSGANLLILTLTENGAASVTLSDAVGGHNNTWLKSPPTEQSNALANCTVIYYAKNPFVGTGHVFTATGASIFAVASVSWYSGADTTAPYDVQNGTGGAAMATGQQPGSVTPSTDGQLVISSLSWASSITVTSITGSTLLDQRDFTGGVNYGGGSAYAIQTTATAYNPAWNWTGGTTPGNIAVATFKAGAAAGDLSALIGEPISGHSVLR